MPNKNKKLEPTKNLEKNCSNPWNNKCKHTEIALYIYYKGEMLPICWSCWKEIADSDLEW